MFPIYLLEDDDRQRNYYKEIVQNTVIINDYPMQIQEASNVVDFKAKFKQQQYGLFFLDMEIDDDIEAGLKVADFVRKNMADAQIVFITTHEELAFLTLERKISPMDYILKDLDITEVKNKIIDDVNLAQKYYQDSIYNKESTFGYKIGSKYYSVPMKELIVLQTEKEYPGRVTLLADNREASFPGSLSTFEKKYSNLMRVDKSSLINVEKIVSYDSHLRILTMADEVQCNVSYRKTAEVSKLFK